MGRACLRIPARTSQWGPVTGSGIQTGSDTAWSWVSSPIMAR